MFPIHGFQKMTLLDFPGRVACTVFLGGCDFRCPFCHNSSLALSKEPAVMDTDELISFLKERKGLLDGVVITGGEPLCRPDLPSLLCRIKDQGFLTKLDTNGNHPDELDALIIHGLVDYVAMDVKNSEKKYAETIGVPGFDCTKVFRSADILRGGMIDYEFRTTVVHELHQKEDFEFLADRLCGAKRYFLQKYEDGPSVMERRFTSPSDEELREYQEILCGKIRNVEIR